MKTLCRWGGSNPQGDNYHRQVPNLLRFPISPQRQISMCRKPPDSRSGGKPSIWDRGATFRRLRRAYGTKHPPHCLLPPFKTIQMDFLRNFVLPSISFFSNSALGPLDNLERVAWTLLKRLAVFLYPPSLTWFLTSAVDIYSSPTIARQASDKPIEAKRPGVEDDASTACLFRSSNVIAMVTASNSDWIARICFCRPSCILSNSFLASIIRNNRCSI